MAEKFDCELVNYNHVCLCLQLVRSWTSRLQHPALHQARSPSHVGTAAVTNALQLHLWERSSTQLPTPATAPPGTPSVAGGLTTSPTSTPPPHQGTLRQCHIGVVIALTLSCMLLQVPRPAASALMTHCPWWGRMLGFSRVRDKRYQAHTHKKPLTTINSSESSSSSINSSSSSNSNSSFQVLAAAAATAQARI